MKIDSGQPVHLNPPKKRDNGTNDAESTKGTVTSDPATVLNLSDGIRQIQDKMKDLKSNDEPRQDLVNEAKAEMEAWDDLSDDKIDSILNKMVDEMNL
jgi:hypothetical protein